MSFRDKILPVSEKTHQQVMLIEKVAMDLLNLIAMELNLASRYPQL